MSVQKKNLKKKLSTTVTQKKIGVRIFRPSIRSRHPSHRCLRTELQKLPFRSVIRLGSTTEIEGVASKGGSIVEINTTAAIRNSANKLLMKRCFNTNNVKTAPWWTTEDGKIFISPDNKSTSIESLPYPIVSKHIFGSRGRGNSLIKDVNTLTSLLKGRDLSLYIFEEFLSYNKEYRLHVNSDGCFYTCRKMIKSDTPEDKRWYKNDSNCTWILETNKDFDRPLNWNSIIKECVKALNSVGLDFGACDLRVQSSVDKKGNIRKEPEFFIVEINSAPSFGDVTKKMYLSILPEMAKKKATTLGILK